MSVADPNAMGLESMTSVTGAALQTYRWMPDRRPMCARQLRSLFLLTFFFFPVLSDGSGLVFLSLGIHDHCGRYDEFVARTFVARQFAVHSFDWHGFGRSAGERGVWHDAALNIVDLHRFICDTLSLPLYAALPYFVVAKAAGVILANGCLDRLMRDNFARKPLGFCVISPAGKVKETYSATRKAVARFVASVAPGMGVASIKVDMMNSVPAELAAYKADPLVVHSKISASLASSMLKIIRETDYSRIRCPVFVLAAENEQVVDADAGVVLFESVPATSKLLKTYDHAYHDLPREPCKEQVFADIGEWMLAVLSASGPMPANERVVVVNDVRVDGAKLTAEAPESLIARMPMLAPLADERVACWSCAGADCHMVFADEVDLLQHARTAHQSAPPYRCFACAKEHSTVADVLLHETSKHDGAPAGQRATAAHELARTHQDATRRRSSDVMPVLESAMQRRGSRNVAPVVVPPLGAVLGSATMVIEPPSPPLSPLRDTTSQSLDSSSNSGSLSKTPPKPTRLSPRSNESSASSTPKSGGLPPPARAPGRLQHSNSLPPGRFQTHADVVRATNDAATRGLPPAVLLPPPPTGAPPAVAPRVAAPPARTMSPPPGRSMSPPPGRSMSPPPAPSSFSPPPPRKMSPPARSRSPPPPLVPSRSLHTSPPPAMGMTAVRGAPTRLPPLPTAARRLAASADIPDFPDVPQHDHYVQQQRQFDDDDGRGYSTLPISSKDSNVEF